MRGFFKDFIRSVIVIAFFVSTLCLSAYGERVFVSPDENSAFFFAKQFANVGSLSVHESLNTTVGGIIHPRSTAVLGEVILPGSFIGLPILAGLFIIPFGDAGGLLLTPVLALFGILAFRTSIKKVFEDEALADLSALLLMAHPAYLYFSGRVMMHNIAFVDFLIFAVYFAVTRPFGTKSLFTREFRRLEFILSGIMVGTALFLRISEALWVLPIAFGLFIYFRNNLGWRNIVSFFFGLGLMLTVIAGVNSWVYGSPFATGYTLPTVSVTTSSLNPSPVTYRLPLFGFHPRAILRNVWDYGVTLYPWMTVLSILGFCLLAFRRFEKNKAWKALTIISIFTSVILFSLYGSWNFFDNPNAALVTIGNSHVRYWLPVFILSIPFTSYLVVSLWRLVKEFGDAKPLHRLLRASVRALLILAFLAGLVANVRLVFYGHDGILASRAAMSSFVSKRTRLLMITEPESVIVVDRADKYLFPYRRVIAPLRDERTYSALPELVKDVPTYYFGITFPQSDLDYLNGEKLKALGLKIDLVETINEESLYKFSHAQTTIR